MSRSDSSPLVNAAATGSPVGVLGSFRIQSFRYQWLADIFSAWGAEMETIILGWYVLVETDSPLLVALVAALRFGGTLIAPMAGVVADRYPRRSLLIGLRVIYLLLAASLAIAALADALPLVWVFVVAGLAGLFRPSEMIIRQSLIADTVPRNMLTNALGFGRTTIEGARVVGALSGAALLSLLGIGLAYVGVTIAYLASIVLTLRITVPCREQTAGPARPFAELKAGIAYIRTVPIVVVVLALSFLVNLTGFPVTMGLLPVLARDVFGLDENGLAQMSATVAAGALAGSILVAVVMRNTRPERVMLGSLATWHVLILILALTDSVFIAFICLAMIGLAVGGGMIPIAIVIMRETDPAFRGRVMGVRMLAVYGLPLGLLTGGLLLEWMGPSVTLITFSVAGLLPILGCALYWSRIAATSRH